MNLCKINIKLLILLQINTFFTVFFKSNSIPAIGNKSMSIMDECSLVSHPKQVTFHSHRNRGCQSDAILWILQMHSRLYFDWAFLSQWEVPFLWPLKLPMEVQIHSNCIPSSFLHFKARSDYRRRSITSPLPVFHTSLTISQFPLCLAMSSKCCGSDSLPQKTFKPSKLVLHLICIIQVVHILNQSALSSLVM